MKLRIAMFTLAALLLAPLAQAEKYYKWQDETGTWHYSNKPPKDQESQPLNVRAKGATPTAEEIAARAEAAKKADLEATLDGSDTANCKQAKTNLDVLRNNPRVSKDVDGDGKEEILSQDEHLAEISATEKQVRRYCGN